jgi:predicted acetyltransferase
VGVAPEYRGSSVGLAMIRSALEETRAQGIAISCLYPATLTFYQRAGYGRAGQYITYDMPLAAIDIRERGLELVPVEDGPYDEFYHAYQQQASKSAGNLERPVWLWREKLEPQHTQVFRYLVRNEGRTEGYVVLSQGGNDEPLTVRDACVLTPAAGRRLLALFAAYRSQLQNVTWRGGPLDPFAYLISEPTRGGTQNWITISGTIDWLLRIVDVAGALQARGYAPGVQGELHFDVQDAILPANGGRYVLHVADGRGIAEPGGEGRIRLDVRELASLYSGFITPAELRAFGAIDGPDTDLALAAAVFAGPRPWMPDIF